MTIIIGIDPGLAKTGWGVVKFDSGKFIYLDCGIVKSNAGMALLDRLKLLHDSLATVVCKFKPDFSVLERIFVNKNPASSLHFAYARGAILLCLAIYRQSLQEISPNSVKKIITGNGHATKDQIKYMVQKILDINLNNKDFDVYDALALAICIKQ